MNSKDFERIRKISEEFERFRKDSKDFERIRKVVNYDMKLLFGKLKIVKKAQKTWI